MARQYELIYDGKMPEKDVLDGVAPATLTRVASWGNVELQAGQTWSNLLIFGDNLPVLKSLMSIPAIRGQVRLVYIDPPFSTDQEFRGGNHRVATVSSSQDDEIAYQDRVTGAEYLEFLRRRLFFLREFLADDGSIYVHIDSRKGHYVKVLMDEIFGEEHFQNDITRVKCNPKNFARRAYGNVKDMIFFYSKSFEFVWNEVRGDEL